MSVDCVPAGMSNENGTRIPTGLGAATPPLMRYSASHSTSFVVERLRPWPVTMRFTHERRRR